VAGKLRQHAPLVADLQLVAPLAARRVHPRPGVRREKIEAVGGPDTGHDVAAQANRVVAPGFFERRHHQPAAKRVVDQAVAHRLEVAATEHALDGTVDLQRAQRFARRQVQFRPHRFDIHGAQAIDVHAADSERAVLAHRVGT